MDDRQRLGETVKNQKSKIQKHDILRGVYSLLILHNYAVFSCAAGYSKSKHTQPWQSVGWKSITKTAARSINTCQFCSNDKIPTVITWQAKWIARWTEYQIIKCKMRTLCIVSSKWRKNDTTPKGYIIK